MCLGAQVCATGGQPLLVIGRQAFRVSRSCHIHQTLYFLFLSFYSHWRFYRDFTLCYNSISLMSNYVEHLFHVFTISLDVLFVKYISKYFSHFYWFVFLFYWFEFFIYYGYELFVNFIYANTPISLCGLLFIFMLLMLNIIFFILINIIIFLFWLAFLQPRQKKNLYLLHWY